MIFLTSLIFVLLCFVIPGEFVLWFVSKMLATGNQPLSVGILCLLNAVTYFIIYIAIRFSKVAYEDFVQEDQGSSHRKRDKALREFLCVYGCRWLNLAGLGIITVGATVLLLRGVLPLPFFFLFAAITAAFLDVLAKDEHVRWRRSLPKPDYLTPQPSKIPPEPEDIPKPAPDEDREPRSYSWSYEGPMISKHFEMDLRLSKTAYKKDAAVKRYRRTLENYPRYVKEGDPDCVKHAAFYIRRITMENGFSAMAEVMNCVYFVRSIIYAHDTKPDPYNPSTLDYANFPIETLWDEKGDCEDHGILAAAVLHELGHDVALFFIELEDSGHIALAYCTKFAEGPYAIINNGKQYAYVETVPTSVDSRIGHICEQFYTEIKRAKVLPIG